MSYTRSDDVSLPYEAPPIKLHSAGTLRGHGWETYALRFSPDSALLAAGSDEAPLSLWNVDRRERISAIDVRASVPWLIAFSPRQPLLAVLGEGEDAQVRTYAGDVIATLPGHSPKVAGLAFLPAGELLLTIDGKGTVRIWQWNAQREVASFPTLGATDIPALLQSQAIHPTIQAQAKKGVFVYGLAVDALGEHLVVNGYSPRGLLQRWAFNPISGTATFVDAHLTPDRRDFVLRHCFSSDGRFLAALVTTYHQVGDNSPLEERIELYQTDPFALLEIIRPPLEGRWCVLKDMAFSPDARHLALAGAGGYQHEMEGLLWIWDIGARQFVTAASVHPDVGNNQVWPISAVDWDATGTLIATAGWEPSERGDMSVIEHLADRLVVKLWQVEQQSS